MKHDNNSSGVNRRRFLKQSSAVAGLASINYSGVSTVAARQTDLHLGSVDFVEVVVEHPNAPSFPRAQGDRFPLYFLDQASSRLTLAGAPLDPFAENNGVVSGEGFRPLPGAALSAREEPMLTVTSDYRGVERTTLHLEEKYTPPRVEVELDGGRATVSTNEQPFHVSTNAEKAVELESRTVDVRERGKETRTVPNPREGGPDTVEMTAPGPVVSRTVTPSVRVRNHGRVDVFGAPNADVVPLDSDDERARSIVQSLKATANSRIRTDQDLLVLEKEEE